MTGGCHGQVQSRTPLRGLTKAASAVPPKLASAAGIVWPKVAEAAGRARLSATTGTLAFTAVIGASAVATGTVVTVSGQQSAASATVARPAPEGGSVVSATGATVTESQRLKATGTASVSTSGSRARRTARSDGTAHTSAAPGKGTVAGSNPRRTGQSAPTVRGVQVGGRTGGVEVRQKARRVTVNDVIRVARSQVGTHENHAKTTKYHDWYMRTPRAAETAKRDGGKVSDYRSAPWCDIFVSWVGDRTGTTASVGSDAFTVEHAKWFQKRKRWGTRSKVGAVAFFDWNGRNSRDVDTIDHVALVIKGNHDGTVQTIEGNTDDAVVVKNRPMSSIVGYGYPDFAR